MSIKEPFVIKTYGKGELAEMYGWHIKTLKRKMQYYGLDWPPDNVLTPRQVGLIVETLGLPYCIFEE